MTQALETPVLDLRTYKLVAGGRDAFDLVLRKHAKPLLDQLGIRTVAFGPSADNDDHYYLLRAFPSARRRDEQLDAFYGSEEWQRNQRETVLGLIETYHTVAIPVSPEFRRAVTAAIS